SLKDRDLDLVSSVTTKGVILMKDERDSNQSLPSSILRLLQTLCQTESVEIIGSNLINSHIIRRLIKLALFTGQWLRIFQFDKLPDDIKRQTCQNLSIYANRGFIEQYKEIEIFNEKLKLESYPLIFVSGKNLSDFNEQFDIKYRTIYRRHFCAKNYLNMFLNSLNVEIVDDLRNEYLDVLSKLRSEVEINHFLCRTTDVRDNSEKIEYTTYLEDLKNIYEEFYCKDVGGCQIKLSKLKALNRNPIISKSILKFDNKISQDLFIYSLSSETACFSLQMHKQENLFGYVDQVSKEWVCGILSDTLLKMIEEDHQQKNIVLEFDSNSLHLLQIVLPLLDGRRIYLNNCESLELTKNIRLYLITNDPRLSSDCLQIETELAVTCVDTSTDKLYILKLLIERIFDKHQTIIQIVMNILIALDKQRIFDQMIEIYESEGLDRHPYCIISFALQNSCREIDIQRDTIFAPKNKAWLKQNIALIILKNLLNAMNSSMNIAANSCDKLSKDLLDSMKSSSDFGYLIPDSYCDAQMNPNTLFTISSEFKFMSLTNISDISNMKDLLNLLSIDNSQNSNQPINNVLIYNSNSAGIFISESLSDSLVVNGKICIDEFGNRQNFSEEFLKFCSIDSRSILGKL
ncbi:MAG: hypothetical protein MHMPM18_002970, partial [Marteilia pararefringens]